MNPHDNRPDPRDAEQADEQAHLAAEAAVEAAFDWESIMRTQGEKPRHEDTPAVVWERTLYEARRRLGVDKDVPRGY